MKGTSKDAERVNAKEAKRLFDSADAAKAAKPEDEKLKLHQVSGPNGVRFIWSRDRNAALFDVCKAEGYQSFECDKAPNKEKVAGFLAALSPADRDAVIAAYTRTRKAR